jgi:hypothetical protein
MHSDGIGGVGQSSGERAGGLQPPPRCRAALNGLKPWKQGLQTTLLFPFPPSPPPPHRTHTNPLLTPHEAVDGTRSVYNSQQFDFFMTGVMRAPLMHPLPRSLMRAPQDAAQFLTNFRTQSLYAALVVSAYAPSLNCGVEYVADVGACYAGEPSTPESAQRFSWNAVGAGGKEGAGGWGGWVGVGGYERGGPWRVAVALCLWLGMPCWADVAVWAFQWRCPSWLSAHLSAARTPTSVLHPDPAKWSLPTVTCLQPSPPSL